MYRILKHVLFLFKPERIHHLVVRLSLISGRIPMVTSIIRKSFQVRDPSLERNLMGIKFPNPVGLAAGFDKNATFFQRFFDFGFGFIEIGTVTPLPQPGNPKPRMFRLPMDHALINRMGFNNDGATKAAFHLKKNKSREMIIGGNIGKNKLTPNELASSDYLNCFKTLFPFVDYFVVNVSSPNTPGLRELQEKEPLMKLLNEIQHENTLQENPKPVLLKIAPDLNESQLDDIIEIIHKTRISGIVAGNTTLSREGLKSPAKLTNETGGLSGKPLSKRSTEVIRYLRERLDSQQVIIGVGGIHSSTDAVEKLNAGANLIQLYTGFIYEGPKLIKKINKAIMKNACMRLSTLIIIPFLLCFYESLNAQTTSPTNQIQHDPLAKADSIHTSFSDRLFKKRIGTSLYTRLYNRFWATDTGTVALTSRKSTWLALPVITYAPETKLNFQAVGLYSFYMDKEGLPERNSSIYVSTGYSQTHQAKFEIKPTIWTAGNKYHFTSAIAYQKTNLKFYGIGNSTKLADEENQKTNFYKVDLEGERLILKNFYAGPVFLYLKNDIVLSPVSTTSPFYKNTNLPIAFSSHSTFLGFNLIYDSRDNQNYAEHGNYFNFNAQFATRSLSTNGSINQYNFDARHFISIGKNQVIALQGVYTGESGPFVPFFLLNQMGNDQIMRGYYQGRFRDLNMTAAQVEYRYLFFPRFGLAAFAAGGEVFSNSFTAGALKPNYGLGGRYVFDTRSRITVRLDYGIGEKPPGEKRISGFYLALGEAF